MKKIFFMFSFSFIINMLFFNYAMANYATCWDAMKKLQNQPAAKTCGYSWDCPSSSGICKVGSNSYHFQFTMDESTYESLNAWCLTGGYPQATQVKIACDAVNNTGAAINNCRGILRIGSC